MALLDLALVIVGAIIGSACLFWWLCADSLDASTIKRVNKGRRRSDQ